MLLKNLFFYILLLFSWSLPAQNDSLPAKDTTDTGIYAWRFDDFFQKDTTVIDTAVNDFHVFNPVYRNNFLITGSTGNLASPSYNLFLDVPQSSNFLNTAFRGYLTGDGAVKFYNTKKFYSNIFYFTNGSKDQNLQSISVLHTQNIKPFWNFAIDYHLYASDGIYANQKSKFSSFVFSSVFEKPKYSARLIVKNQQFKTGENGGIVSKDDIGPSLAPANVPVHLTTAANKLRNLNINLTQGVPLLIRGDSVTEKKLSVSHTFMYNNQKHFYTDVPGDFYTGIFFDSTQTYDSTRVHHLINCLRINLSLNHTYWFVGYENKLSAYFSDTDSTDFIENSIIAGGRYHATKISADLRLQQIFAGYYQGNFFVNGRVQYVLNSANKNMVVTDMDFYNRRPDYFYAHFSANNFVWDTTLQNEQILTFRPTVVLWNNHLELGASYKQWQHFGYYDSLLVFNQLAQGLSYVSASVQLRIPLKHFYFHTHLLYQQNSQSEKIDFPDLVAMQSLNVQSWFFKRALFAQFGVEVNYFTSFYGRGYIPAISQFFVQQTEKIGDYPFVDVYMNFKIKRARIFFKLQHLNEGMNGVNYFTAINYPMQQRAFRFGISWAFYD